ncbi:restriction endonuclease [Candidatus Bathyarchaeota archaeon]|nr:MAG: restriction endonuclease [Candidatus Bathyarchaeota archaeon]
MVKIRISINELKEMTGEAKRFPTYVSPIINLANRFAQGTRPHVVGQLSEMIKRCPYKTYEGWKKWYLSEKPNAIDEATNRIMGMLDKFREVLSSIDEEVVRAWVEDLVLVKTFAGLRFQEPILKKIASILGKEYRLSTPEEESKGIDGFVGEISISIKPYTYKTKPSLMEEIKADKIIFYEKKNNEIIVDLSPIISEK